MPTYNADTMRKLKATNSLGALRDMLNELEGSLAEQFEDHVDTTSLPVFGGEDPSDTSGIYSWDAENVLVHQYGRGWLIEAR